MYCMLLSIEFNAMTAMVKIGKNFDIHAKVKFKHCQTLRVVSAFTGQNELTILTSKSIILYC